MVTVAARTNHEERRAAERWGSARTTGSKRELTMDGAQVVALWTRNREQVGHPIERD